VAHGGVAGRLEVEQPLGRRVARRVAGGLEAIDGRQGEVRRGGPVTEPLAADLALASVGLGVLADGADDHRAGDCSPFPARLSAHRRAFSLTSDA
jgi:hypothetical protein